MSSNTPYYNAAEGPAILDQGNAEWKRGTKQGAKCQDLIWGILFYVQLGVIGILTAKYAPIMTVELAETYATSNYNQGRRLEEQNEQNNAFEVNVGQIWFLVGTSALISGLLSTFAMTLMSKCAQVLIKMALFFNIFVTAGVTIVALVAGGSSSVVLLCGVSFVFALYYAYVVWNRVAFAASNLVTATTAVQANLGLTFLAYSSLILSMLWSVWWAVAFVSTNYVLGNCNPDGTCEEELNGFIVFLLLVSYFWTAQVIKNVVHVTVAGTVGTWWFAPYEASGCCSQAVRDSYTRSMTTSFGSISLGSLLVSLVSATREMLYAMREQNNSLLLCLADCLLGCIESLLEYFNSWAFVYVGLYNYSFIEAGSNVMTLFKSRGWSAIVADILVDTVLLMVSLAVGILTGLSLALLASFANWSQEMRGVALIAGTVVGFIFCTTMFSLISSGVNAVIVCYAEAPAEFQENHPHLAQQMLGAWKQAYPNEFQY
ncbi:unnamed protein product [Cylindrotheca closterium]|uniref:Choline transporter-like protein n=1 Tax=Cylindrotheca closterium TaxID=2856 RepID=A0AAD2PUJ9_9STRA|nr:unnamed protein product [Cylindrotheca closterium]